MLLTKPTTSIDRETWQRYAQTKDPALRNELVMHYSYVVKYIVMKMGGMFRGVTDQDDLVNEGIVALMEAVERYDAEREVKFETYASIRVKGAVIDYIRKQDWVPRRVRKNARNLENALSVLWTELGREPTDQELAGYLGITETELHDTVAQSHNASVLSFEELLEDGVASAESAAASLGSVADLPEDALYASELKSVLTKSIDRLPPKEKLVVAMYYFEHLKLREIAQVMQVSESRVCQLHTSALAKMRKNIEPYVGA